MRMRPTLVIALLFLLACAGTPSARDGGLHFVVVRHAEKASDAGRDPPLSRAGQQRAQALARQFADADLVAIYSSDVQRTRQTVEPTAASRGMVAMLYDASRPAAEFVAQLRERHRSGTILIAGHSNTVPALVAAFCNCETTAMSETEYDRYSTIRIAADGSAHLAVTRYGKDAPGP